MLLVLPIPPCLPAGIETRPLLSAPLDFSVRREAPDDSPVLWEAGSCEWAGGVDLFCVHKASSLAPGLCGVQR